MGFPIRKFSDQNLHTAPRNLSQYITSFIGFQCQGIRHTPLNAWFMHRKKFCVESNFVWNVHLFEHSMIVHLFEQSDIDIVWLFLLFEQSKLIFIIYNLKKLKVSKLVEDSGIEPLTSWMQIRRSPSWANPPWKMVGRARLERATSPLSGVRSNHLSYRPLSIYETL